MANTPRGGLGKGLGALIPGFDDFNSAGAGATQPKAELEIKIIDIEPCKNQPRKSFDTEQLNTLAESIRTHGVIQPIVVRSCDNGRYEIIAGERRWRASRIAGLRTIPAIVRELDDHNMLEIALIENLQREDLNPIEEANGYSTLINEYQFTQELLAQRIGKSRSAVANMLRLLTLPDVVQQMIADGQLLEGHARALMAIHDKDTQMQLAQKIAAENLSVRDAERIANLVREPKKAPSEMGDNYRLQLAHIGDVLGRKLGAKVRLTQGKNKGRIQIEYYSNEDLERILKILEADI